MRHRNAGGCSFTASGFRREELERFVGVAGALGLDVECEFSGSGRTARIRVSGMPDVPDAEAMRTRNAGPRSIGINPPPGSMFSRDTPCAEFLAWQDSHSVADGMAQLGLSRRTYFRRMRAMREKVAECDRINASRDRSPEWDGKPRLVAKLGDIL